MAERRKQIAVITSIVMLSVMLFAAFYIISETGHECTDEACPICAHIEQFEAMLNGSDDDASAAGAAVFAAVCAVLLLPVCVTFRPATPITAKVRMNY